jgi:hypothetical protein
VDSIEIIYYNIEKEIHPLKAESSLLDKIVSNPGGSWTVGENCLFRPGGKFLDFRLNSKSLKETIEENLSERYFDNQIFNLGATIFFNNIDFIFPKIQLIRLMGNIIQENDILNIYNNFNNKKHSLDYIRQVVGEERNEYVSLTVCRSCGDYECGLGPIKVERVKDKIRWDLDPLCRGSEIENEHFQYEYEFDLIEYKSELESFEKYYQELLYLGKE